jgi:hypothetical protein
MKTAIRIFAFSVVLAGAAAASITPSHARLLASHQAANAAMPIPACNVMSCPPGK